MAVIMIFTLNSTALARPNVYSAIEPVTGSVGGNFDVVTSETGLSQLSLEEWLEAFRESGMTFENFNAHMPSGLTMVEIESLLPNGITLEKAASMWYDQEQDMYFYPVLGLFYCPDRAMWYDPYRSTWHNLADLLWDLPIADEPWGSGDEHITAFAVDENGNIEIIYVSEDGGAVDINSLPISTESWYGDIEATDLEWHGAEILFEPEYCGEVFYFYDLPIINDYEWYEWNEWYRWYEGDNNSTYQSIMPLSNPTLTFNRNSTGSTFVSVTGTVSNPGGANITARGFIIRVDTPGSQTSEVTVSTTSNTFSATITGLTPNTPYLIRSFVRVSGVQGRFQSNPEHRFVTLGTPQTPTLNISHTSWNPSQAANNLTVSVTSNTNWNVSSNATSWLTVTPGSGSNNGSFTIRATANASSNPRSGAVTVTAPGATTRNIPVTQAGAAPTITAPVVTLSAPRDITSTTVTLTGHITSNGGAPITARGFWIRRSGQTQHSEIQVSTSDNQFTQTLTNLIPGTTYYVRAFARNTATQGSGISADRTFTTTQQAATLSLSHSSWAPPREAGNLRVTVTSNTIWTVSSNASSWLTVSPQGGGGDSSFTINATANTGTASRSGTVTVTAGGVSRTVAVTQSATPAATITFNPNGGTVTPATRVVASGSTVGSLPVPTRVGHNFLGWFHDSSGGIQTTPNTVVTQNVTFFAVWALSSFTLTLSANGGTVSPVTVTRQFGQNVGELPVPTRFGHGFLGWFTAQTGGSEIRANTSVTNNMTLFARWTPTTITFDSEGGAPVVPASRPITPGQPLGPLPPTPRRQGSTLGHRFIGWHAPSITHGPALINENTIAQDRNMFAFASWAWDLSTRYHWRQWGMWLFWRNNNVPLRTYEIPDGLEVNWFDAMEAGRLNWNNSAAPVHFTANQPGNNRVRVGNFNLAVVGDIYFYRLPGSIIERFTIRFDVPLMEHRADITDTNILHYIESVMAHELGHAVGLTDCFGNSFGGNANASIMNRNRNRSEVRGPTAFDIELVERIYD